MSQRPSLAQLMARLKCSPRYRRLRPESRLKWVMVQVVLDVFRDRKAK